MELAGRLGRRHWNCNATRNPILDHSTTLRPAAARVPRRHAAGRPTRDVRHSAAKRQCRFAPSAGRLRLHTAPILRLHRTAARLVLLRRGPLSRSPRRRPTSSRRGVLTSRARSKPGGRIDQRDHRPPLPRLPESRPISGRSCAHHLRPRGWPAIAIGIPSCARGSPMGPSDQGTDCRSWVG